MRIAIEYGDILVNLAVEWQVMLGLEYAALALGFAWLAFKRPMYRAVQKENRHGNKST